MKIVAIAIAAIVAAFLALVAVLVVGVGAVLGAPSPCGPVVTGPVEVVAATIRQLESNGNYTAQAPGSSASGAYQFIDTTWAGYGGYRRAADAPPAIQDAKALEHITGILNDHGNNVAAVPVVWYIGRLPADGSAEWDTVPFASAGNVLTPRQYQARWLDTYAKLLNGTGGAAATSAAPTCNTATGTAAIAGTHALPIEPHWFANNKGWATEPHHCCTPGIDIPIPVGTPLFAATAGTLTRINQPSACGWGYQLNGDDGFAYVYCHLSAPTAADGARVNAGDPLGASGGARGAPGAGNSTGPHLHLGIRRGGTSYCPQPALQAWSNGQDLQPSSLPTTGCVSTS